MRRWEKAELIESELQEKVDSMRMERGVVCDVAAKARFFVPRGGVCVSVCVGYIERK